MNNITNLYDFLVYIIDMSINDSVVFIGKNNRYYFDGQNNMHYYPNVCTDWIMTYNKKTIFNKSFINKKDVFSKIEVNCGIKKSHILNVLKKIKINFFKDGISYTDTIIDYCFDDGILRDMIFDSINKIEMLEQKKEILDDFDLGVIDDVVKKRPTIDNSGSLLDDITDIDTDF